MFTPLTELDTNKTWTLDELSKQKAAALVPSVVYLGFITVIGVIGNALVLTVFYFRFGSSTHRCFILVLAGFDFSACAIGGLFTMTNSFYIFTYTDTISCRLFRFILYHIAAASSLTLVFIACERFRKICRPLKSQLTVSAAKKYLFIVTGVVSPIIASPSLVFYGNLTIETGIPNLVGTNCFVNDLYKDTMWPTAFNIMLLVFAVASTLVMAVCYAAIARQVGRMGKNKIMRKAATPGKSSEQESSCDNVNYDDSENKSIDSAKDMSTGSNIKIGLVRSNTGTSLSSINEKFKRGPDKKASMSVKFARKVLRHLTTSKSSKKTLRITKMLTFITMAFVISYLPHLTLQLWDIFTTKDQKGNSSYPTDNLYQVIWHSFLLNNLVNPFIYAAMDLKFRQELINLLKLKGLSKI